MAVGGLFPESYTYSMPNRLGRLKSSFTGVLKHLVNIIQKQGAIMAFSDIQPILALMKEPNKDAFSFTVIADLTSTSKNIVVNTVSNIEVGKSITGVGIPDDTTISSITESTKTVELSAVATRTSTEKLDVWQYTDTEIKALSYDAAYNKLKQDIQMFLSITDTNLTSTLDSLYTDYKNTLEYALTYLQLYYFFRSASRVPDDKEIYLAEQYLRDYNEIKIKFKMFENSNINTAAFNYLVRT